MTEILEYAKTHTIRETARKFKVQQWEVSRLKQLCGLTRSKVTLSPKTKAEIKVLFVKGVTIKELVYRYGTAPSTMRHIVKGATPALYINKLEAELAKCRATLREIRGLTE